MTPAFKAAAEALATLGQVRHSEHRGMRYAVLEVHFKSDTKLLEASARWMMVARDHNLPFTTYTHFSGRGWTMYMQASESLAATPLDKPTELPGELADPPPAAHAAADDVTF